MHCSQMATIRQDASEFMNKTLTRFANMKGKPNNLLHSADVAVLIISDNYSRHDAYGMAYPETGSPFSVVLYSASLVRKTFSHEIAHNFGVDNSTGYVFNKRMTIAGEPASKFEKGVYHITIMADDPVGIGSDEIVRTNYFSNPNIIHPILKLPIGKRGKHESYLHFEKNISAIAANGDESCKCHEKICELKSKAKSDKAKPDKAKPDKAKDNLEKRYDIRKPGPPLSKLKQNNLYKKYLKDLRNLYQDYLKDDQRLYKNYLRDAHRKIHEMKKQA